MSTEFLLKTLRDKYQSDLKKDDEKNKKQKVLRQYVDAVPSEEDFYVRPMSIESVDEPPIAVNSSVNERTPMKGNSISPDRLSEVRNKAFNIIKNVPLNFTAPLINHGSRSGNNAVSTSSSSSSSSHSNNTENGSLTSSTGVVSVCSKESPMNFRKLVMASSYYQTLDSSRGQVNKLVGYPGTIYYTNQLQRNATGLKNSYDDDRSAFKRMETESLEAIDNDGSMSRYFSRKSQNIMKRLWSKGCMVVELEGVSVFGIWPLIDPFIMMEVDVVTEKTFSNTGLPDDMGGGGGGGVKQSFKAVGVKYMTERMNYHILVRFLVACSIHSSNEAAHEDAIEIDRQTNHVYTINLNASQSDGKQREEWEKHFLWKKCLLKVLREKYDTKLERDLRTVTRYFDLEMLYEAQSVVSPNRELPSVSNNNNSSSSNNNNNGNRTTPVTPVEPKINMARDIVNSFTHVTGYSQNFGGANQNGSKKSAATSGKESEVQKATNEIFGDMKPWDLDLVHVILTSKAPWLLCSKDSLIGRGIVPPEKLGGTSLLKMDAWIKNFGTNREISQENRFALLTLSDEVLKLVKSKSHSYIRETDIKGLYGSRSESLESLLNLLASNTARSLKLVSKEGPLALGFFDDGSARMTRSNLPPEKVVFPYRNYLYANGVVGVLKKLMGKGPLDRLRDINASTKISFELLCDILSYKVFEAEFQKQHPTRDYREPTNNELGARFAKLHPVQIESLKALYKERVILVSGPGGTGKSSVFIAGAKLFWDMRTTILKRKYPSSEEDSKVLVVSPTGIAAHNIKKTCGIGDTIDFILYALGNDRLAPIKLAAYENWCDDLESQDGSRFLSHSAAEIMRRIEGMKEEEGKYIYGSERFDATCDRTEAILETECLIVEEASKCCEKKLFYILNALPNLKQVILVFDNNQTGPYGSGFPSKDLWDFFSKYRPSACFEYNMVYRILDDAPTPTPDTESRSSNSSSSEGGEEDTLTQVSANIRSNNANELRNLCNSIIARKPEGIRYRLWDITKPYGLGRMTPPQTDKVVIAYASQGNIKPNEVAARVFARLKKEDPSENIQILTYTNDSTDEINRTVFDSTKGEHLHQGSNTSYLNELKPFHIIRGMRYMFTKNVYLRSKLQVKMEGIVQKMIRNYHVQREMELLKKELHLAQIARSVDDSYHNLNKPRINIVVNRTPVITSIVSVPSGHSNPPPTNATNANINNSNVKSENSTQRASYNEPETIRYERATENVRSREKESHSGLSDVEKRVIKMMLEKNYRVCIDKLIEKHHMENLSNRVGLAKRFLILIILDMLYKEGSAKRRERQLMLKKAEENTTDGNSSSRYTKKEEEELKNFVNKIKKFSETYLDHFSHDVRNGEVWKIGKITSCGMAKNNTNKTEREEIEGKSFYTSKDAEDFTKREHAKKSAFARNDINADVTNRGTTKAVLKIYNEDCSKWIYTDDVPMSDMQLADACTVDKFQSGQEDTVIMVLESKPMPYGFTHNHIYTEASRARKRVIVVTNTPHKPTEGFFDAIRNAPNVNRNGGIKFLMEREHQYCVNNNTSSPFSS